MAKNNYTKGGYSQPDHDIDPKDKDEKWHREWCEFAYSAYVRDRGGILYSKRSEYELFRLFAQGNQPTERYKDILDPKGDDGQRKGLMNISWDILSVAPRIIEAVIGMFMKLEHDVSVNAIDEKSGADKEQLKHRLWADKQLAPFFESLDPQLAQQLRSDILPFLPDSMEEIKMMQETGAFKLKQEIAMEKAIDYTMTLSDWVDIKRRIFEDLFILGIAGTKDYVEPATQLVKTRYVDPARAVINYSKDHNFRNMKYAGELVDYTAAELRKAAPDLTEEQIQDCIKRSENVFNHDQNYEFDRYHHGATNGSYNYDDARITVLDLEWFDYDVKKGVKKKREDGSERFYEEPYNTKTKKSKTRTPMYSRLQTVRKCKWVVGTDYVFDWGYQHDIPRPNKAQARLSYHFYKASDKSKLSSMIPHLDNIQLSWLEMNNAIAKAAPAGLAVEVGSLGNIKLGGKKMSALDILDIRRITGDLLFKSTNQYAQVVSPNSGKPITPTDGGVGVYLDELIKKMQLEMQFIRDVTGINEFVDATTPDPNTPVGTGKLAVASANNVLHTLYLGYQRLHENTAENVTLRWSVVARANKGKDLTFPAVGGNTMEILKIGSDIGSRNYGLKIEERPTMEEIAEVKQAAIASMQKASAGGPGITLADFQVVSRMLKSGHAKQAEMYMAHKEQQAQERIQAVQRENMEINGEQARKTELTKAEIEMAKQKQKIEGTIAIEKAKSENRMNEEMLRHRNKIELAQVHGSNDLSKVAATQGSEAQKQSKQHDHEKEIVKENNSNRGESNTKVEAA